MIYNSYEIKFVSSSNETYASICRYGIFNLSRFRSWNRTKEDYKHNFLCIYKSKCQCSHMHRDRYISMSRYASMSSSTSVAVKKVFCKKEVFKDLNPEHKYLGLEI